MSQGSCVVNHLEISTTAYTPTLISKKERKIGFRERAMVHCTICKNKVKSPRYIRPHLRNWPLFGNDTKLLRYS